MTSREILPAVLLVLSLGAFGCGSTSDDDDGPVTDDGDDTAEDDGDADDGDDGTGDDGAATLELSCQGASGTRLRQIVARHSDGSWVAQGMHDTSYDVDCSFALGADGSLRCLPGGNTEATDGQFGYGTLYFTGADCTGPVVRLGYEDRPPTYAETLASTECGPPSWHYQEVGALLEIEEGAALYTLNETGCVATVADIAKFHAVVGELPASAFVGATASPSDTGRISVEVIQAEDGARQCPSDSLRDADLGACRMIRAEDGVTRCLVGSSDDLLVFADAECAEPPIAALVADSCESPVYALDNSEVEACGVRVRTLGPALPPPVFDEYCGELDGALLDGSVRPLGDIVPPSSFVALERVRAEGGARLDRVAAAAEGGLVEPGQLWFDRVLGVECAFEQGFVGGRCLPVATLTSAVGIDLRVFTDAACTDSITLGTVPSGLGCEEPALLPTLLRTQFDPITVYEAGERYSGPLFWRESTGCTSLGDRAFYRIGAEVPASSLVALEAIEIE